jgi:quercetin dioxygenase-like cupin family protein
MVVALSLAAISAVYATAAALATPSTGLTTTILTKSLLDEIDINAHTIPASIWQAKLKTKGQTDVYVVDNKIVPGGTTGWHSHPGPSLILVVAGTVTNYEGDDPSCTPHVYSQGSGFIDEGGTDVHTLRNEGSVPAETIAVQLLPKDAARRTDMPAPGNCPF